MVRLDSDDQVVRCFGQWKRFNGFFTLTAAAILRDGRYNLGRRGGEPGNGTLQSQLAWWSGSDSLLRMLRWMTEVFTRLRQVEIMPSGDSALFVCCFQVRLPETNTKWWCLNWILPAK